jgi:hypothetical protein
LLLLLFSIWKWPNLLYRNHAIGLIGYLPACLIEECLTCRQVHTHTHTHIYIGREREKKTRLLHEYLINIAERKVVEKGHWFLRISTLFETESTMTMYIGCVLSFARWQLLK